MVFTIIYNFSSCNIYVFKLIIHILDFYKTQQICEKLKKKIKFLVFKL